MYDWCCGIMSPEQGCNASTVTSLSNVYRIFATNTRRLLPRATRRQANTTLKFVELEGNRIGRNGGEVGGAKMPQRPVT